jgi:hypothetical protein
LNPSTVATGLLALGVFLSLEPLAWWLIRRPTFSSSRRRNETSHHTDPENLGNDSQRLCPFRTRVLLARRVFFRFRAQTTIHCQNGDVICPSTPDGYGIEFAPARGQLTFTVASVQPGLAIMAAQWASRQPTSRRIRLFSIVRAAQHIIVPTCSTVRALQILVW